MYPNYNNIVNPVQEFSRMQQCDGLLLHNGISPNKG